MTGQTMADWRDVMNARADADEALQSADNYGVQIKDGMADGDLTVLLAARAVCLELRALSVLLGHEIAANTRALSRA